jgi:hypothetical protein
MELSTPGGYPYTYDFAIGGNSTQLTPQPPEIIAYIDLGQFIYIIFTSVPTETYTIKTSEDLIEWDPDPSHTGVSNPGALIERYVLKPSDADRFFLQVDQD